MQTFLPYFEFEKCAKCLDSKRLNKQIVEGYQILFDRVPTLNHPACILWKNHKYILKNYLLIFCNEYTSRYNKIHSLESIIFEFDNLNNTYTLLDVLPEIIAKKLVFTHKINLLKKNFEYYNQFFEFFEDTPDGYFWINPLGKVSKQHTENWEEFFKHFNLL